MRNPHPAIRLIANFAFGLSVLAGFAVVSIEMASHHFQGAAERAVRRAFADGGAANGRERDPASCRSRESGRERVFACDPIEAGSERSLRSTSCRSESLLRVLGRRWHCAATFVDGATIDVDVSLGLGRRKLELQLPVHAPDARSRR